jgi:hypothetical protein
MREEEDKMKNERGERKRRRELFEILSIPLQAGNGIQRRIYGGRV